LRALGRIAGGSGGLAGFCGIGAAAHVNVQSIAASVGADVPFCVAGGAALATGIGDVLEPLRSLPPNIEILLANPGIAVSTVWAYAQYDKNVADIGEAAYDGSAEYACVSRSKLAAEALKGGCFLENAQQIMKNALEPVTVRAHPEISSIKALMLEMGARAAMMSGSGPTVFGLFGKPGQAQSAAAAVRGMGYWAAVCRAS
jgi:4-diphosphocytidyl-2-C-methyl-D-erythritol kinase